MEYICKLTPILLYELRSPALLSLETMKRFYALSTARYISSTGNPRMASSRQPFSHIIIFTFCIACDSTPLKAKAHERTAHIVAHMSTYCVCSHNLSIFHSLSPSGGGGGGDGGSWLNCRFACTHIRKMFRLFRVLNLL